MHIICSFSLWGIDLQIVYRDCSEKFGDLKISGWSVELSNNDFHERISTRPQISQKIVFFIQRYTLYFEKLHFEKRCTEIEHLLKKAWKFVVLSKISRAFRLQSEKHMLSYEISEENESLGKYVKIYPQIWGFCQFWVSFWGSIYTFMFWISKRESIPFKCAIFEDSTMKNTLTIEKTFLGHIWPNKNFERLKLEFFVRNKKKFISHFFLVLTPRIRWREISMQFLDTLYIPSRMPFLKIPSL